MLLMEKEWSVTWKYFVRHRYLLMLLMRGVGWKYFVQRSSFLMSPSMHWTSRIVLPNVNKSIWEKLLSLKVFRWIGKNTLSGSESCSCFWWKNWKRWKYFVQHSSFVMSPSVHWTSRIVFPNVNKSFWEQSKLNSHFWEVAPKVRSVQNYCTK